MSESRKVTRDADGEKKDDSDSKSLTTTHFNPSLDLAVVISQSLLKGEAVDDKLNTKEDAEHDIDPKLVLWRLGF
jgi:hypothetical protein